MWPRFAMAISLLLVCGASGFADKAEPDGGCFDGAKGTDSTSSWPNLSLFLGLDGSKQPQDLGVNAHVGPRLAVNGGTALVDSSGLGLQFGTAVNYHDSAVTVLERIDGTKERFQSFTTLGLFQRNDAGLTWALGYDLLAQNYYDQFLLGQWRARAGYAFRSTDEMGVWWTVSDRDDAGEFAESLPVHVDTIVQGSLFWRRCWPTGAETTLWAGVAERHGEFVLAFPDDESIGAQLVYGAAIHVPLTDRLAVYGEANLITPSDSGTVDAYLGCTYSFGRAHDTARGLRRNRYLPVLAVANNTNFAVDLRRR